MGMARMMQEAWNRRRVALFHLVLEKACSVPSGRQLTSRGRRFPQHDEISSVPAGGYALGPLDPLV